MEAETVRTQIQLTEEQVELVKRIAAERHVSMAKVIREALDRSLRSGTNVLSHEDRIRRAIDAAGRFRSGTADGSAKHDRHLTEAYRG